MEISEKIAQQDITIYDQIKTQLYPDDKISLLAIQNAVRNKVQSYTYLEIGSYLGGSIQPYLLDKTCKKIISIDKRPLTVKDTRTEVTHKENSTAKMLALLKTIAPEQISKIQCFDKDATEIPVADIKQKPDICFIDGEHTNTAVISDFKFCYSIIKENGVICFHDANLVHSGLSEIINDLKSKEVNFRAYFLPSTIFVIEFNRFFLHQDPKISFALINNHLLFLPLMQTYTAYIEKIKLSSKTRLD